MGLERWTAGAALGTRIRAHHRGAKRGWLLHQSARGVLDVDAGAARALREGRSLLPKGVVRVQGRFAFGDVVRIDGPHGPVAQGLSNYASSDAERIRGLGSSEIAGVLGSKDFDELVHRNQLVLLPGERETFTASQAQGEPGE